MTWDDLLARLVELPDGIDPLCEAILLSGEVARTEARDALARRRPGGLRAPPPARRVYGRPPSSTRVGGLCGDRR